MRRKGRGRFGAGAHPNSFVPAIVLQRSDTRLRWPSTNHFHNGQIVPQASKLDERAAAPVYFVGEAARYLRLPPRTIEGWVFGNSYRTADGLRRSASLIKPADPQSRLLSFYNLVELHVISAIKRRHGVNPKPLRKAIDFMKERYGTEHPFLEHEFKTDGTSLFIEQYGELVNVSEQGQIQMKKALDSYLKRIAWKNDMPVKLYPFTREAVDDSPTLVAIDPRVRSGKPCISGTAIPTSIVAERYRAGDSAKLLATDYERSAAEIEEALRYEWRQAA